MLVWWDLSLLISVGNSAFRHVEAAGLEGLLGQDLSASVAPLPVPVGTCQAGDQRPLKFWTGRAYRCCTHLGKVFLPDSIGTVDAHH